jgi:hypothetical protein
MYKALKDALRDLAELDRIEPATENLINEALAKAEGREQ